MPGTELAHVVADHDMVDRKFNRRGESVILAYLSHVLANLSFLQSFLSFFFTPRPLLSLLSPVLHATCAPLLFSSSPQPCASSVREARSDSAA
eukprot:1920328-Rhodomonas_salina.1